MFKLVIEAFLLGISHLINSIEVRFLLHPMRLALAPAKSAWVLTCLVQAVIGLHSRSDEQPPPPSLQPMRKAAWASASIEAAD